MEAIILPYAHTPFVFQQPGKITSAFKQNLRRLAQIQADPLTHKNVRDLLTPIVDGNTRKQKDFVATCWGYSSWRDVSEAVNATPQNSIPSKVDEDLDFAELLVRREEQFHVLRSAFNGAIADDSVRDLLKKWQPTARDSRSDAMLAARRRTDPNSDEVVQLDAKANLLQSKLHTSVLQHAPIELGESEFSLLRDSIEASNDYSGSIYPDLHAAIVGMIANYAVMQPSATQETRNRGLYLLEKLAAKTSGDACVRLASLLFRGEFGVKKDHKRAYALALMVIDRELLLLKKTSLSEAYRIVGCVLDFGEVDFTDLSAALKRYEQGAKEGDPYCAVYAARILGRDADARGPNIPDINTGDIDRAIAYCEAAIPALLQMAATQAAAEVAGVLRFRAIAGLLLEDLTEKKQEMRSPNAQSVEQGAVAPVSKQNASEV